MAICPGVHITHPGTAISYTPGFQWKLYPQSSFLLSCNTQPAANWLGQSGKQGLGWSDGEDWHSGVERLVPRIQTRMEAMRQELIWLKDDLDEVG